MNEFVLGLCSRAFSFLKIARVWLNETKHFKFHVKMKCPLYLKKKEFTFRSNSIHAPTCSTGCCVHVVVNTFLSLAHHESGGKSKRMHVHIYKIPYISGIFFHEILLFFLRRFFFYPSWWHDIFCSIHAIEFTFIANKLSWNEWWWKKKSLSLKIEVMFCDVSRDVNISFGIQNKHKHIGGEAGRYFLSQKTQFNSNAYRVFGFFLFAIGGRGIKKNDTTTLSWFVFCSGCFASTTCIDFKLKVKM